MQSAAIENVALSERSLAGDTAWSRALSGRARLAMAALVFRVALDLCYIFYMNPVFDDHFLTPMPINIQPLQYFLSFGLAVLPATFIPYGKRDFSGIFFLIPMTFIYLPLTSIFGLDANRSIEPILLALLAIAVSYGVSAIRIANVRLDVGGNRENIAIFVAYGFVIYFVISTFFTGAIDNINFDFSKMYDLRDVNQEILDVGFLAYLNLWAQKVFNPFLLAIAMYKRNWPMIIGAISLQIFFFAVTQHRDHLVVPIVIFLAMQLYVRRLTIPGLLTWFGILLAAVLLVGVTFKLDPLSELIIRRPFFVPASLTYDWVSFFSDQAKVYWSDGVLESFSHTRYSGMSVQWYIGYFISRGKEVELNVGLVGTGYAQAGYLGVILYAAILGGVVKLVNTMIRSGLPPFLPAALLFGPVGTAWANTDMPTALLTHGIMISILLMLLYGSPNAARNYTATPLKKGPLKFALPARR